jgi:hypothetical protein
MIRRLFDIRAFSLIRRIGRPTYLSAVHRMPVDGQNRIKTLPG